MMSRSSTCDKDGAAKSMGRQGGGKLGASQGEFGDGLPDF